MNFNSSGLLGGASGGNSYSPTPAPTSNQGGSSGLLGDMGFNDKPFAPIQSEFGSGLLKDVIRPQQDVIQSASDFGFDLHLPRDGVNRGAGAKIVKMLIFKTGGYQQQYLRPVSAQSNVDVEQVFASITEDGTVLSNNNLSQVASAFLQPSSTVPHSNIVHVENGWDTPRMRFMYVIDDDSIGTNGVRYFVSGFFDHSEHTSSSGDFNPRAKMYVTRAVEMVTTTHSQGGVMNNAHRVNNAVNLMSSQHYGNECRHQHMRPQDIFSVLSSIKNSNAEYTVEDLRVKLMTKPRLSSMRNDSMSMFLTSTMSAARDVIDSEYKGDKIGHSLQTREENIRGSLGDPTLIQMKPLNLVNNQTQWETKGYIEWRELAAIFPEINTEQVTTIQTYQKAPAMLAQVNQSEQMNTAWSEGIFATILSQELPPTMLDYMLTKVGFVVDGFQRDPMNPHMPVFIFDEVQAFDQRMLHHRHLETFKNQVLALVYPRVSQNGLAPIRFRININIYGDCRIEIGTTPQGSMVPFVIPMFAVNTMLSIITPNRNDMIGIANAVNTMTNVIENQAANKHGQNFNW